MTIGEVQKHGLEELKQLEEAPLKVRLLMAYVLGKPKEYTIIHSDEEMDSHKVEQFYVGIRRLKEGEPLAYITHHQEFMKLDFYVDENVLIPRPDTEVLVETVLEKCTKDKQIKILDLCTGSGAIAVSLAKYLPNASIVGTDISKKALEIAKKNALQNEVQVSFIESNLWENVQDNDWDVIVSNPPYIETSVIKTLQKEVQKEPRIALDGGEDGLNFYRQIIAGTLGCLKTRGILALEIGYNEAEKVTKMLKKSEIYDRIEVIKDLGGNDRVVVARR